MPVDGDTYDVPLMIESSASRRKALGQPDDAAKVALFEFVAESEE